MSLFSEAFFVETTTSSYLEDGSVANGTLTNMNVTVLSGNYAPYRLRPETYIVPAVFSLIFIVGIMGNGTLVVIFALNKSLRNAPNTYIISLAVGDLFVLCLSMPFVSTIYVIDSWPFGLFMCRFSEFFRNVSVGVTVFTLTALSADRYLAIVSPFRRANKKGPGTTLIALGIWFFACLLSLPDALTSILLEVPINSGETISICYPFPEWLPEWYKKANVLGKALVFYVIPLLVIGSFYLLMAKSLLTASEDVPGELRGLQRQMKTRKKVAKIVLWFVGIFALCFLPNHIFLVWFYFDPNSQVNYNGFWHALRPVGFTLSFVNSCVNPIALYCISGLFRKYYNQYLCYHCCCCCREYFEKQDRIKQHPSISQRSVIGRSHYHSSSARPTDTVLMTALLSDPRNGHSDVL